MTKLGLLKVAACVWLIALSSARGSSQNKDPKNARIDEIILEATEGRTETTDKPYGPSFRIHLSRNGSASFFGKSKVKLIGDYYGTISKEDFERLVDFIADRQYSRIPEDPVNSNRLTLPAGSAGRASVYDVFSPRMTTSISTADGNLKTISRPTDLQPLDRKQIPNALLEIEQAIFDAATRVTWHKKN